MQQQINLYQPVIVRGSGLLTSTTVAIALAIVTTVLIIIYSYGLYAVTKLSHHVDEVRVSQQKQTALLTLNAANATPNELPALQAQVKNINVTLTEHRRALQLLRIGAAGGDSGFSERLIALANQHIDGMWLDHIVLGSDSGVTSLDGGAMDAQLIPQFLSMLAAEPALRGSRINQFDIVGKNVISDEGGEASPTIKFHATNADNLIDKKIEPTPEPTATDTPRSDTPTTDESMADGKT